MGSMEDDVLDTFAIGQKDLAWLSHRIVHVGRVRSNVGWEPRRSTLYAYHRMSLASNTPSSRFCNKLSYLLIDFAEKSMTEPKILLPVRPPFFLVVPGIGSR